MTAALDRRTSIDTARPDAPDVEFYARWIAPAHSVQYAKIASFDVAQGRLLRCRPDDGIFVVEVKKRDDAMEVQDMPLALRDQLGLAATAALVDLFERQRRESTVEITGALVERFEQRLSAEIGDTRREIRGVREEMQLGSARLREDMASLKFDILKWSFAFSMAHTAIVVTFVGLMLQAMQR